MVFVNTPTRFVMLKEVKHLCLFLSTDAEKLSRSKWIPAPVSEPAPYLIQDDLESRKVNNFARSNSEMHNAVTKGLRFIQH